MNLFRPLRLLALTMLLAVANTALATDPDVEAITRDVARPAVLRGAFNQEKQVAGFRNPLRSQGTFVVARERGVIWSTLEPFPSELVITAERILSRQRDGSTRVELDAREQPAMRSVNAILFALMSGDVQALSSQFTVQARRDGNTWILALAPKSPMLAKAFTSLELRGDRYVRQVTIVEASNDRTLITFSGLRETPAVLSADEAARLE